VSAQPFNQVWAGYQRPLTQTEEAGFASFDMSRPVEIRIDCTEPAANARIRPSAAGIIPRAQGDVISFRVERPGQYTVEVNGMHRALHLFADPPELDRPALRDPHIRFFGPGVHFPGLIRLTSNETLELAAGSIVHGAVISENATNVSIRGRGILDGSGLQA
jgi:hypothetical protein